MIEILRMIMHTPYDVFYCSVPGLGDDEDTEWGKELVVCLPVETLLGGCS